jgi:hypothetical protein
MAEVTLLAEWRRSFRHFRHSATCRFYILCAVSTVIAVFKTAKTAITALYLFNFHNSTNQHNWLACS